MGLKVQAFDHFEQANKIFTDREEPRRAFWNKYHAYRENMRQGVENDIAILTFYGIGGIGKTTLLNKLQQELKEYRKKENTKAILPHVYYDMKTDTNKRAILESLRRVLSKEHGFQFPIFDLALSIYLLKTGNGTNPSEAEGFISRNQYASIATDLASAGIDMLNIIPLAGPLAAGTIKIIDKLVATQKNKNANRRVELSKLQDDSPEEILGSLHLNFARDLADNLKDAQYPLVVLFDTYEMLVNEMASVGDPLMNDCWLRDLRNGLVTHTPHTIWVMAGRDTIKWDQINSDWQDNLEQHLIGKLSEVDAKQYLTEAGIEDLGLQEAIYELTKGIPVYLDICTSNYFYLKNEEIEITAALLGKDEHELIERFIRYADDDKKDMIYLLSCLGEWTEEDLQTVASGVFGTVSLSAVKKVKGYSFVETSDGIHFRMHQLVKEVVYRKCYLEVKQKANKWLIQLLKEKLEGTEPASDHYANLLRRYVTAKLMQTDRDEMDDAGYGEIYKSYILPLRKSYQYEEASKIIGLFVQHAGQLEDKRLYLAHVCIDYANALVDEGKYKDAVIFAEKAVALYEGMKDACATDRMAAEVDLSTAYSYAGRPMKAAAILETVLAQRALSLGDEHADTLSAMCCLSSVYSYIGRYKEAAELSEKVLAKRRVTLGEVHLDTLSAMNMLSHVYDKLGKYHEALDLSGKVVEMYARILGEEDLRTTAAMISLSRLYGSVGEYKASLDLSEKALNKLRAILGDEHPDTLTAMENLSGNFIEADYNQEGMALAEQVLALRKRILGDEHLLTIASMSNLAGCYLHAGFGEKGLDLSEQALKLMERVMGKEHPYTLLVLRNICAQYCVAGRLEEALEHMEKALELMKGFWGEDHPETVSVMNLLALIYRYAERMDEAIALSEKVYDYKRQSLGEVHPDIVSAMTNLVYAYAAAGKHEEVRKLAVKGLEISRALVGEDHANTVKMQEIVELMDGKRE